MYVRACVCVPQVRDCLQAQANGGIKLPEVCVFALRHG
jgi:hypothetical protein